MTEEITETWEKSGVQYLGMDFPLRKLLPGQFSEHHLELLHEIPKPPEQLWYQGQLPKAGMKLLAVVGSRKYSAYGKQALERLLPGLASYPIGIVSGLALGIDALAHETALAHGLYTLAIPGSGLDSRIIAPRSNQLLAERILRADGGLLSELEPQTSAAIWTFPLRNRIMAGLTHATLLIEAGAKSGTLITARLAVDYNRELLAVPGSIFSQNSYGVHQFLKLGATMVTEPEDILLALGIEPGVAKAKLRPDLSPLEEKVLAALCEPTERDILIRTLALTTSEAAILLMQMEMQGYIKYEAPHYFNLLT